MQQLSRPLAPAEAVFCFLSGKIFLNEQNMKIYQHYFEVRGLEFYQIHVAQWQFLGPLMIDYFTLMVMSENFVKLQYE